MVRIFGVKPKRSRTKKTLKEKIDAQADKKLLEWFKNDDEILRLYINKREGLNIPPESERKRKRVLENAIQKIYGEVADNLRTDPQITEAVRDQFIAELGLPIHSSVGRGNGGQPPRRNFKSRMEEIKRIIDQSDQIKELLGISGGWQKFLENPEVIKTGMQIIQGLIGPLGLNIQNNTTPDDNLNPTKKIDKNLLDSEDTTLMQQQMQQKDIVTPVAELIIPDQCKPSDKQVASANNQAKKNSNKSKQK